MQRAEQQIIHHLHECLIQIFLIPKTQQNPQAMKQLVEAVRGLNEMIDEKQVIEKIQEKQKKSRAQNMYYTGPRSSTGYNKYTPEQKQRAVDLVFFHKLSYHKASMETGIPQKNIKRWKEKGIHKKKNGGRKAQYAAIQIDINKWIDDYRVNYPDKDGPNNSEILEKATEMIRRKHPLFKGSRGFLDKFKKRREKILRQRQENIKKEQERKKMEKEQIKVEPIDAPVQSQFRL